MNHLLLASVLSVIWVFPALAFECKGNDPAANAYCSDYCRSLNPGNHVAGTCAKDEISCLCETKNNKTIKVRVLQEQIPKPHVEKPPQFVYSEAVKPTVFETVNTITEPPMKYRTPQEPQAQMLMCDGSPTATATCNSFCVEVVNGSGGICNIKDQTCRCKDVQFIKKEPIKAMYIPKQQKLAKPLQISKPPVQNIIFQKPSGFAFQNQILSPPQRPHPQQFHQNIIAAQAPQPLPQRIIAAQTPRPLLQNIVAAQTPLVSRPPGSVIMQPQLLEPSSPASLETHSSGPLVVANTAQTLEKQPQPQPPNSDQPLQGSRPPKLQTAGSEVEGDSTQEPDVPTVSTQGLDLTSINPQVATSTETTSEIPKHPLRPLPGSAQMQFPPQTFHGVPFAFGQSPQNYRFPPPHSQTGQFSQQPLRTQPSQMLQQPSNQQSQFPHVAPQGPAPYLPNQYNSIPAVGNPPRLFSPFFQLRPSIGFQHQQQQPPNQFVQRVPNFPTQNFHFQPQHPQAMVPQFQSGFRQDPSPALVNIASTPTTPEKVSTQSGAENETISAAIDPRNNNNFENSTEPEATTETTEALEGGSTTTTEEAPTTTATVKNTGLFSPPPLEYGFKGIPSRSRMPKRLHHELLVRKSKCEPDDCRQSCIARGYSTCIPLCMPQGCHCSCAQDRKYILHPIYDP